MTYYVRAYCPDGEVPTIGTVLAWAGEHGSQQRDQVLAHLAGTRFLVSLSLPISAPGDDALWEAVSVVLDYFTEHHGAVVHIEGEGFSQAGRVILETTW